MGIVQKVAVITGASRGIGAALVKAYRDRNYSVVANVRSGKRQGDEGVLYVAGDIADRKTAEQTISEGMARFGRIDTLINNAGIFISKPFTKYSEADFAAMLSVNPAQTIRIGRTPVFRAGLLTRIIRRGPVHRGSPSHMTIFPFGFRLSSRLRFRRFPGVPAIGLQPDIAARAGGAAPADLVPCPKPAAPASGAFLAARRSLSCTTALCIDMTPAWETANARPQPEKATFVRLSGLTVGRACHVEFA